MLYLYKASYSNSLFESHVGSTPTELIDHDLLVLAKWTENYSGSDISVAVRETLMEPIRTVQRATHFKNISTTVNGVRFPHSMPPRWLRSNGDELEYCSWE